jgi:hypothetical protein
MVAATVSSGIASELTMLAANLAFSRQDGFSASFVTTVVRAQPQSTLTVTGSDRLRNSCSRGFGSRHLAL